jgi:hypothetical protein
LPPLGIRLSAADTTVTTIFRLDLRSGRHGALDWRSDMLRDVMLWILGVPIIAIIALHLLGILH